MSEKVGVVGLGYVGLPLALAIAKIYPMVGVDTDVEKCRLLDEKYHHLRAVFTSDYSKISDCSIIIVALPTPVDANRTPDLSLLTDACQKIGLYMKRGCLILFESTVFPGATRNVCVPTLERYSGEIAGEFFNFGYSPERINPGDNENTLHTISKLVSGNSSASVSRAEKFYRSIIDADIVVCDSIEVAEGAKLVENVQRDVNIALMNELRNYFSKQGIEIKDVLAAASTKWNFCPFHPGLVGGHCIGVDPYYLIHSAKKIGVDVPFISAARLINEQVRDFTRDWIDKKIKEIKTFLERDSLKILFLGLTYKPNVGDFRESAFVFILNRLCSERDLIYCFDPFLHDSKDVELNSNIIRIREKQMVELYDLIIIGTKHANTNIWIEKIKQNSPNIFIVDTDEYGS